MSGKGKLLETFVAIVEEILLPAGVKITKNERVYNPDGVQIAEFDIQVEGKFGSTNLKLLIECRDRPSQGPAPGEWIEQLAGRRDRFNFSKVIAVSTTGFAQGAIDYAKDRGIELRTVKNSNLNEVQDWLILDGMTVFKRKAELKYARLGIDKNAPKELVETLSKKIKESEEPHLFSIKNKKFTYTGEAFQYACLQEKLYEGLRPEDGRKKVRLKAYYPQDDDHFVINPHADPIRITEILFYGEVFVEKEFAPLSSLKKYQNVSAEEEISTQAGFEFNIIGIPHELSLHKVEETGETHIFLSSSGEISDESD